MHKFFSIIMTIGVTSAAFAAEPAATPEREAKPRMEMKQHFQRLDQDGNGTISRDEAKANPRTEKSFEAMDTNKDGQVNDTEYREHLKAYLEQHREKSKTELNVRWEKADANHDGMLSREEAAASPRLVKHFDAIDADKNGQISVQEIGDFIKAQRTHKTSTQS